MKKLIWSYLLFFLLLMLSCKKDKVQTLPVLTTIEVSSVTDSSAFSGGIISYDGNATITERGVCWSLFKNPTTGYQKTNDGTGSGTFTSKIKGLTFGTVYHFRAFATNSVGTAYGNDVTFITNAVVPTLTTSKVNVLNQNSATCDGNLISMGDTSLTAGGVCWSTQPIPTINDNKTTNVSFVGIFTSQLIGLLPSTTYYVRAYAMNRAGVGYGNTLSFTTLPLIYDADGNEYHSIIIGTQVWLVENLKTTRYRNGDLIPIYSGTTIIGSDATYDYNNDENNSVIYGRLYNWTAVMDSRNICPIGWHVPSIAEWGNLLNISIEKLQETGTLHWKSNNIGATNETGFTALPGGGLNIFGFTGIGAAALWWTSSRDPLNNDPYNIYMSYDIWGFPKFYKIDSDFTSAYSVRCIKD